MKKEIKINKTNEIIHTKVSKTPTIFQQRMYNVFLYAAKQKLNNLQKTNKNLYIALRENNFNDFLPVIEIDLKFLFAVIQFGKNSRKYFIEQIKSLKDIEMEYNILKKAQSETENQVIFNKENIPNNVNYDLVEEWGTSSLIISPKISFKENKMYFYLAPMVLSYLDKMESYTGFNILIPAFITSTYVIRMYEYLLRSFNAQNEMQEKGILYKDDKDIITAWIDIDKLQDIIGISKENTRRKSFKDFKRSLLVPTVNKINTINVIEFLIKDFELKKEGRKYKKIRFILISRPLNQKQFPLYDFTKQKIITLNYEKYKKTLNSNDKSIFPKENENNIDIPDELIKLKEEVINNKIIYTLFKRKLQQLPAYTNICNKVLNYKNKSLILRVNKYSHLELFNPKTKENIQIEDFKNLEKIRKWLFDNPDRIADFADINPFREELNEKFLYKYIIITNDNKYYVIYIKEIVLKNDEVIFNGDEKVYNKNLTISFKKENIKDLSPCYDNEIDEYKIKIYLQKNNEVDYKELSHFFKKNKKHLDKMLEYIENENLELAKKYEITNDETIYNKLLNKEKWLQYFIEEDFEKFSTDRLSALKYFKKIIEEKTYK